MWGTQPLVRERAHVTQSRLYLEVSIKDLVLRLCVFTYLQGRGLSEPLPASPCE